MPEFECISITVSDKVAYARLNRPKKANALDRTLWFEVEKLAEWVDQTSEIRVLVLGGEGRHFCSGIDFSLIAEMQAGFMSRPQGRRQEWLYHEIRALQRSFSAIESCSKPVIASVHGACFGGGIDLITACDLRYCDASAQFCVKEIDLAIVADIGTIQRLPTIVGEGVAREMTMTARVVESDEAVSIGLVNRRYGSADDLSAGVREMALILAAKSPLALRNTKKAFNYSRDHSVSEGLEFVANLNAGILFSNDAMAAMKALQQKKSPVYDD